MLIYVAQRPSMTTSASTRDITPIQLVNFDFMGRKVSQAIFESHFFTNFDVPHDGHVSSLFFYSFCNKEEHVGSFLLSLFYFTQSWKHVR